MPRSRPLSTERVATPVTSAMIVYSAWSIASLSPLSQASWQLSTVLSWMVHASSPQSAVPPPAVAQKQLFSPYLVMSQVPPASMQLSLTEQLMSLRNCSPLASCVTPRPSDVQTPKVVVEMESASMKSPTRPSAWSPMSG